MSRFLVTGAAGFIASQVCELLLSEGNEVVGVDNMNDYYDIRLKEYRLNLLEENRNASSLTFVNLTSNLMIASKTFR